MRGQGSDLDAFMRQVLAKRDDNWKKLQQYVLDERETIDLRGPGNTQLWGERHDYTWFIRDGFFVRSPVRFNGVTIGESERRKYEQVYLDRQKRRERRREEREAAERQAAGSEPSAPQPDGQPAVDAQNLDVDGLLRQAREPEFIRAAYFLRFRFEEGQYALVGRESIAGRETLKIEHYPTNLFRGSDRRRGERSKEDQAEGAAFRRLMNKTSLVTLWVEPTAHQILKYEFDNIALDFFPARWLARMEEFHAGMTMTEAFPTVWLPGSLDFKGALSSAVGQFDLTLRLEYHDYRQPDVTSKVTVPKSK